MVEFDDVSNFVSLRVFELARALERHSETYLRSFADIGVREWRILVRIHRFNETRPIDLADTLGIELGNMLGVLARLEETGHVEMQSHGSVGYHLTSKGTDLFDVLHPLMQNRQRRIVEMLEPTELESFSNTLDNLRQRIDTLNIAPDMADGSGMAGTSG